jgi:hypothetical protein
MQLARTPSSSLKKRTINKNLARKRFQKALRIKCIVEAGK